MKYIKQFFILISLIFFLILPFFVFALTVDPKTQAPALQNLIKVGEQAPTGITDGKAPYSEIKDEDGVKNDVGTLPQIIGTVVSIFLGFLGTIFIILTIYAGFTYMMAQGNEDKVKKALDILRAALIGLAIVVGSYGIYTAISAVF